MRLSTRDRVRVQAALEAAQARTHARFALMIVPVSDRYAMYPLAWAGMFAIALGAIVALFWQTLGLRLGFLIEAAAFGTFAQFFDSRPLRLLLVPKRLQQARARNMAHREFGAGILAARDKQCGMLFFASLAERYVEIIADHTVHERVGDAAWSQIVTEFSQDARTGSLADAFVSAIQTCAYHLETHFPKRAPSEAHA
jgi:putative membrane protein